MKRWLSLITGMAFFLVMSGTAMAAVDLNASPATPLGFASEIAVDETGGTTLQSTGTADLNAQADWGFGASEGATRFVRFDLSEEAEFAADPSYAIDGNGNTAANVTISSGGAGDDFVIFQVTAPATETINNNEKGTLTINTGIDVYNENNVTLTYRQFETGVDAVNELNSLATSSSPYITWTDALVATVNPVTTDDIDVASESLLFTGTTTGDTSQTRIGNVSLSLAAPVPYWTTGNNTSPGDVIATGSALVVSGNFSAVGDSGRIFDGTTDPYALNTDRNEATATFGASTYTSGPIVYEVSEDDVISKTTITGTFDLVAATGSDVEDIDLGTLSELDKNGETKTAFVIPKPDGLSTAYIRITNTSSIDGRIFGRLYAQNGDMLWSGTLVDNLEAHETTVLRSSDSMPNNLAEITGLSTWEGRSRLVIEGEISEMEVLGLIRRGADMPLTNMSPVAPTGVE